MDVYGEHGNGENAKLFQKTTKKVNSVYPTGCHGAKLKPNAEENNHLYISEVELQMHSVQAPLWTRPGISFQVVMDDSRIMGEDCLSGEIEIEKIPYGTVEVRSEVLKPVIYHVNKSNSKQLRRGDLSTRRNILITKSKSQSSECGIHSRRSSSNCLDRMADAPAPSELYSGTDDNYFGGFAEEGFVNTPNEEPPIDRLLEPVNIREELKMEAPLEFVNYNSHTEDVNNNAVS
ncbi:hypothetical protein KSP40_PGU007470 [Platanthera guangdongensis]|uniref:BCAS3 domain-containing protein n=1 Tax=Platanthera guangdongensis TaxID=2320717 RepID=A0ABR2MU97_9ASPA